MMAATVETAGERQGHREGLPGSAAHAWIQVALCRIMAPQRPDTPSADVKSCFPMSDIVVQLLKRPSAVVGWMSSGKSRIQRTGQV